MNFIGYKGRIFCGEILTALVIVLVSFFGYKVALADGHARSLDELDDYTDVIFRDCLTVSKGSPGECFDESILKCMEHFDGLYVNDSPCNTSSRITSVSFYREYLLENQGEDIKNLFDIYLSHGYDYCGRVDRASFSAGERFYMRYCLSDMTKRSLDYIDLILFGG